MKWVPKPVDPDQAQRLAEKLRADPLFTDHKLSALVSRILVTRGITDPVAAQNFLHPSLAQLHSPYLMAGMKAAVDRIDAAIEHKDGILIYGDYDVDGTTAIVILKTAIELCGGTPDFHVPHRIKEGYDLRGDVIERAAAAGIRLVISVDAGIRAFAAADTARHLGIDLIVTDHHLPGPDGVPHALAVLNPNQTSCGYPCKAICGAGVAFKLAQALMERRLTSRDQLPLLKSFAKIAAIATIADAVPLTGENRVFAKVGLEALRNAVNPGLKALLEIAQVSGRPLTSGEVAFRIAPRINAAGRMDIAADVIELFSTKDDNRAREIANKLDKLNGERQEEERRILQAIEARLTDDPSLSDAFCLVIDGDGWHRGVIGITATRVVERYCRPAIVVSRDHDDAHGSGRSIKPFHLLNALESCGHLFTRFGGHAHAVGFSMPAVRIPELRTHLDQYARAHLTQADFEPMLEIDEELSFQQVTPALFAILHELEPFGVGNPEPVFLSRRMRLLAPPRILKDKHVKLKLGSSKDPDEELSAEAAAMIPRCDPESSAIRKRAGDWRDSISHSAVGWQMAERIQQARLLPGDTLDVAFSLEQNDHPEFGGLELSLRDFRAEVKQSENTNAIAAPAASS
jgi:single-stranded-DNA-specific exonuclease